MEDKEHRTVRLAGLQLVASTQTFVLPLNFFFKDHKSDQLLIE